MTLPLANWRISATQNDYCRLRVSLQMYQFRSFFDISVAPNGIKDGKDSGGV